MRTLSLALRLRLLAVSGLTIALLASACGQTRIVGRVVDDEMKPVQAASVETDPPTDYIVTNHFGFFVIDRQLDATNTIQPLAPRPYKVIIKKLGFRQKVLPSVDLSGGKEQQLGDVVLKRKKIEMLDLEDPEASQDSGPSIDQLPAPVMGE